MTLRTSAQPNGHATGHSDASSHINNPAGFDTLKAPVGFEMVESHKRLLAVASTYLAMLQGGSLESEAAKANLTWIPSTSAMVRYADGKLPEGFQFILLDLDPSKNNGYERAFLVSPQANGAQIIGLKPNTTYKVAVQVILNQRDARVPFANPQLEQKRVVWGNIFGPGKWMASDLSNSVTWKTPKGSNPRNSIDAIETSLATPKWSESDFPEPRTAAIMTFEIKNNADGSFDLKRVFDTNHYCLHQPEPTALGVRRDAFSDFRRQGPVSIYPNPIESSLSLPIPAQGSPFIVLGLAVVESNS